MNTKLIAIMSVIGSIITAPAATVITTDFEGLSNSDDDTIATYDKFPPIPTGWVAANTGYQSTNQGANLVGTNTVWSFRYTNSGITSDFELIGNLQVGMTITITWDAFLDDGSADGGEVAILTFADATRNDISGGIETGSTGVLASTAFTAGTGQSLTYTVDGSEFNLGDDVAIRFDGATTTANIDNLVIEATVIPEPSVAILGGIGMLLLLRRRRG